MELASDKYERPTLHIVIAEDEDEWADHIQEALCKPVREWGLCRTEQFHLQVHCCPTVQDFQETVGPLLATGHLVYATLDMKMPMQRGGEMPDVHAGRRMVGWCLEREKDMPRIGQSFEFCLISREEAGLEALYRDPDLQAKLRKRGVKRVYKNEVDSGVAGDLSLGGLWPDIREFVLKHLRFCTFPERLTPDDPEAHPHPIWFDPGESPARLLVQADKIARRRGGGLYLLFADAEGYDVDWFRLVCHLRGVKGGVRDCREIHSIDMAGGDWREVFRNPPEALLVRHIEYATREGYDIHAEMKASQFLSKARQGQSLVFVRFPFFATQLEVGGKLEAGDLKILDGCLREIHGKGPPFDSGIGFAYADHDHIIAFPDYEKVLKPGVIRHTIAFQSRNRAKHHGLEDMLLDPEVAEVMSEIPWNEVGLDKLHSAIRVAYRNAAESRDRAGRRHVGIKDFSRHDPVGRGFDSELGFRVRGRRLFRLLEQNGPDHPGGGSATEDGRTALASLEVIHELFAALERLVQLKEHLQNTSGEVRFGTDFTVEKFAALKGAYAFLASVFETPEWLHDRIAEFRTHAVTPHWKHFYPGLRHRKGWLPLVEHIGFTWPFAQVPLHRAVDQYLSDSGVIYEILTEPQTVLERHHQDLQPHWEQVETNRTALLRRVHDREEQRRAAALYVRQHHPQPVVVHLDMPEEGPRHTASVLTRALQSLVYFNAYLAVCENQHQFGGRHCSPEHVREVRESVQLGASVDLLCNYCRDLEAAGQLGDSVFRFWSADWPRRGQHDALRVASRLAGELLSGSGGSALTRNERELFTRIRDEAPGSGSCGVRELLKLLCVERNSFEKLDPQVFLGQRAEIWDLMRRFVAATTAPVRVGTVGGDTQQARLWARRAPEIVATGADERLRAGDTWVFEVVPGGYKPLFPVGDVIRLHPTGDSVWSWYGRQRWLNLSHLESMPGPSLLPLGPENPWLS